MTNETIPDWAREEAVKRLNAEGPPSGYWKHPRDKNTAAVLALARLIAKHEQPPADSDLATARGAHAAWREIFQHYGPASAIDIALAAIKLHKERNP